MFLFWIGVRAVHVLACACMRVRMHVCLHAHIRVRVARTSAHAGQHSHTCAHTHAYTHTARVDERMADLRRQEQELERDKEARLTALAEMAGDLAARKTEEGRRGAAQAAAVEEEICQARARRAAAAEELASAEAAASAAAAARSEDRDMVQTEVDAVRESTVRTQAETRRLSTKQISLTDEHQGVVRARREATARLEKEMQTAAAAWPGETTALEQAERDAELRLERLRAQILSLRAAVQPHEARRGRLLDLLRTGGNGAGSALQKPGEDVRDTGAKGADDGGGEDRAEHGNSRKELSQEHSTKQAVAQARLEALEQRVAALQSESRTLP